MELFWEHGYEGTSLSLLTESMGITSTSLYAAFGSKEELFREAVELYNSADDLMSDRALNRYPTAKRAIEALLRENADAYTDPSTPRGCMVVLAATNVTTANKSVHDYLAHCRKNDYAVVRARLNRGVAEGDLPPTTDTAAMAAFYLTVLHGLSIQARDGCSNAAAHAIIDRAMLAWEATCANGSG
ncbi:TetR/AcrR family transcriptional regulator [Salinactinospora qingdaonensis]|uniref:TetR/AcrR family transcriptional regulator n=2 Tax=Salinactinospora qingdaonensis TaxID=702744 RepID=A0ABP7GI81_9ACTN